jgi:hypothetical protein
MPKAKTGDLPDEKILGVTFGDKPLSPKAMMARKVNSDANVVNWEE